jgi:hypothetical protein
MGYCENEILEVGECMSHVQGSEVSINHELDMQCINSPNQWNVNGLSDLPFRCPCSGETHHIQNDMYPRLWETRETCPTIPAHQTGTVLNIHTFEDQPWQKYHPL